MDAAKSSTTPMTAGSYPSLGVPAPAQADQALGKQLEDLGFSDDYIRSILNNVNSARSFYQQQMQQYLGMMPPADKNAPPPKPEDAFQAQLWSAQLATATQNMSVMESIAVGSTGMGNIWGSWSAAGKTAPPAPAAPPPAAKPKS